MFMMRIARTLTAKSVVLKNTINALLFLRRFARIAPKKKLVLLIMWCVRMFMMRIARMLLGNNCTHIASDFYTVFPSNIFAYFPSNILAFLSVVNLLTHSRDMGVTFLLILGGTALRCHILTLFLQNLIADLLPNIVAMRLGNQTHLAGSDGLALLPGGGGAHPVHHSLALAIILHRTLQVVFKLAFSVLIQKAIRLGDSDLLADIIVHSQALPIRHILALLLVHRDTSLLILRLAHIVVDGLASFVHHLLALPFVHRIIDHELLGGAFLLVLGVTGLLGLVFHVRLVHVLALSPRFYLAMSIGVR